MVCRCVVLCVLNYEWKSPAACTIGHQLMNKNLGLDFYDLGLTTAMSITTGRKRWWWDDLDKRNKVFKNISVPVWVLVQFFTQFNPIHSLLGFLKEEMEREE